MLREVSASLNEPRVRKVLWILGALFTLGLIPFALAGALIGGGGAYYDGEDRTMYSVTAVLGLTAVLGIVGAWLRVLLSNARFEASSRLRATVASLLALGVFTAVLMVALTWREGGVAPVLLATAGVLGTYLLCATVGAK